MGNKNKKIGLWLILGPFIGLIIVFMLYAISSFIFASIGVQSEAVQGSATSMSLIISSIIRVILGLIGVLCVLGIIIGIPLGIIYLKKNNLDDNTPYDERSGKGKDSAVPEEIKGWNWGALGLSWIWGVYYNVWISLLVFIPFFNIIWMFVLASKGNEWAWRKTKWQSVEQFKATQNKWKIWGIVFFLFNILGWINLLINFVSSLSNR